jgi:hypothetical protein
MVVGLRFEQVRQPVIPLAHGLIDYPLHAAVRETCMIQKCCFDALFRWRILTRTYFLLACLLNHAVEHLLNTHQTARPRSPSR